MTEQRSSHSNNLINKRVQSFIQLENPRIWTRVFQWQGSPISISATTPASHQEEVSDGCVTKSIHSSDMATWAGPPWMKVAGTTSSSRSSGCDGSCPSHLPTHCIQLGSSKQHNAGLKNSPRSPDSIKVLIKIWCSHLTPISKHSALLLGERTCRRGPPQLPAAPFLPRWQTIRWKKDEAEMDVEGGLALPEPQSGPESLSVLRWTVRRGQGWETSIWESAALSDGERPSPPPCLPTRQRSERSMRRRITGMTVIRIQMPQVVRMESLFPRPTLETPHRNSRRGGESRETEGIPPKLSKQNDSAANLLTLG